MEIRTYDEVDPSQVLRLNLLVLDFPLTPGLATALRQVDGRYHPFLAFYAVESGEIAGQAGLLTTTVETTEGPMAFGAAWAVCTRPEFGRRGVARSLMLRVEQAARELGCHAITLGTNRTRVAHGLYRSLGYEDLLPTRKAFDAGLPARPLPEAIAVRRVGGADLPAVEQTFFVNTSGMLGFVRRPKDFLQAAVRTSLDGSQIHGVYRSDRLVGYLLARLDREILRVSNAVLPPDLALHQVVDSLRGIYSSAYVIVEGLTQEAQVRSLGQAGYDVSESWGTVMLKPLAAHRDFRALLGWEEGRFYMDRHDIT